MSADTQLDTLEAKGLVRLAAYLPEIEYLFRHWLVQDAAYGSLLKQERRELHRLVGEAMEALYAERAAELAGVLAMHFEEAGDAERALTYLLADGRYALERSALREAFSAFDRGRALLPPRTAGEDAQTARRRIEIELGRARAGHTFATLEQTIADLQAMVEPAEALGDLELLAQVHLYLALIQLESGRKATVAEVQFSLQRVAEIGAEIDDPSLGALPLALVGLNKVFIGPIREGVEMLEQAIPMMEHRRDFIGAAFARGWLAIGYASLGDFERAAIAEQVAVDEAARGDVIAQLDAQIAQAMIRSLHGDLDDALPIARACIERSQASGATACAVVSAWVLGDIYQRQGKFDDARATLQMGYDLAPVSGGASAVWRPTLNAWLGSAQAMLGVTDPDDVRWLEALAATREIGNRPGEGGILWKRAETRARHLRLVEALEDYQASAQIHEQEGALPTLARVLRGWGTTLRAAGRDAEGEAKLRRALELFEQMGIEREAQELRGLLG